MFAQARHAHFPENRVHDLDKIQLQQIECILKKGWSLTIISIGDLHADHVIGDIRYGERW
jgi:hypothetical protein